MVQTVVYVVDSLGLSGKTRALTNLALNLDRARFKGFVVTFAPPSGGARSLAPGFSRVKEAAKRIEPA